MSVQARDNWGILADAPSNSRFNFLVALICVWFDGFSSIFALFNKLKCSSYTKNREYCTFYSSFVGDPSILTQNRTGEA